MNGIQCLNKQWDIRCSRVLFYFIIIWLCLSKHAQASQAFYFTIEPQDVTVTEGSSVLLQCAGFVKHGTHKTIHPHITWRGPDGQDIGIVGDTFRNQLKNGSLYISSVENNRGLTGSYQCLLTADDIGTIISRSAVVSIVQFPEINQDSKEIFLLTGQTAYFPCIVSTVPSSIEYTVQWIKDDKPLIIDKLRMVLLPNNDLEIDDILLTDKGSYECNVTFHGTSRQSSKSNLDVQDFKLLPISNEKAVAPTFLVKPTSKTVREGAALTLTCVANGIPRPVIKWLRNGEELDLSDLDSRFSIVGTGSLQILSAEDDDSGSYQCRASNDVDSLDAEAIVQVQIPPKFIRSPQDNAAKEKEELELECNIHGKPKPMVQWLKNGDVITPNDYMQLIAGHNLRIKGLLQTDAGMFQCIGTNPAGSIQGAAQLRIIKSGSRHLPKNKFVTTKALKNNKNGINKKLKTEMSNNNGSGSITANEEVLHNKSVIKKNDKTDFVINKDEPNNLIFETSNKKTNMKNNVGNYNKMTGYIADFNNEFELKNENFQNEGLDYNSSDETFSHNLSSAKSFSSFDADTMPDLDGTDDLISQAINGEGVTLTNEHKSASTFDAYNNLALSNLPGPPRELTAQIIKSRFVTLSWLEPSINPMNVISYSVFYKMNNSEREQKILTKSSDELQVNVQSLLPGKRYLFRVEANSKIGNGESTKTLEVYTQPEENVAGPPQNVVALARSHKEIYVRWQQPLMTYGGIVKYRVLYIANDGGTEMYQDTQLQEVLITELRPNTEYIISVIAFNSNGMGDISNEIKVKTFSSIPTEPPNNVTVEVTSSTSITIHWEPPAEEERNGQITGYKIRYRKLTELKGPLQVKSTPGNVRFSELSGLERKSEYQVRIAAMTVNGTGPFTEWYRVMTLENDFDESQVPGKPNWMGIQPGAETIALHWGPPYQQEIKIRNYVLGWGRGIPDENSVELKDTERYFVLKNLEPNTEYVVSLRARNLKGDGQPIYDNIKTREEEAFDTSKPLEVPVGLRAITMSSSSIVIYWIDTSLSKNQHVPDERFYTIRYGVSSTNRYRYYNTTDLNCMINDLKANTQYEFSVKLVKGRRESEWSMSVLNSTFAISPIGAPRDLIVRGDEQNPQSVLLQWSPPKNGAGQIIGYSVYYTTDTSKRDRDWSIESYTGEETLLLIPNLKPYTRYYFKVQGRTTKPNPNSLFSTLVSYTTGATVIKQDSNTVQALNVDGKTILYIIVIASTCLLIIFVGIISLLCKRKTNTTPEHAKKSYQKNNVGVPKPPDLWINHDQIELKNIDKKTQNSTSLCSDAASSSGALTLPRSVVNNEYEIETPIPSHCTTNSLDKCNYITGYMTTSLNSTIERPTYPRTQYNIPAGNRPHLNIDNTLSQQSLSSQIQGGSLLQTPEHPFVGYETNFCPTLYANASCSGVGTVANNTVITTAESTKRGHPLKSFSVPGPPPTGSTLQINKHTPSVTIRPQNQSPYKKTSYSTMTPTNRIQGVSSIIHSTDEIQRLAPSTSTEELNQEMANLEGLMKDLSAITANEFEC